MQKTVNNFRLNVLGNKRSVRVCVCVRFTAFIISY